MHSDLHIILSFPVPKPAHAHPTFLSEQYWDQQEPTYNGVLGGFGFVSDIDVRDSKQLLLKVSTLPSRMFGV